MSIHLKNSFLKGNEKEEWSDSGDSLDITTSDDPGHAHPLPPPDSQDGYGSGDLGDVSCSYVTEVPDREGSGREGEKEGHGREGGTKKGKVIMVTGQESNLKEPINFSTKDNLCLF